MNLKFDHPIIDAEAHHLEFRPKLDEYLRQGMGSRLFEDWLRKQRSVALSLEKRSALRLAQPGWWTATPATQAVDRAAATAPQLMQERMEEMGIDYMILKWNDAKLLPLLAEVRHRQGRLLGRMEGLGFRLRAEASLTTLTGERKTQRIEPYTQQDIINQALVTWLKSNGYDT